MNTTDALPCDRKVRYSSRHAAKLVLRQHRSSYAEARVYFCQWCAGWHITRDRWGKR